MSALGGAIVRFGGVGGGVGTLRRSSVRLLRRRRGVGVLRCAIEGAVVALVVDLRSAGLGRPGRRGTSTWRRRRVCRTGDDCNEYRGGRTSQSLLLRCILHFDFLLAEQNWKVACHWRKDGGSENQG